MSEEKESNDELDIVHKQLRESGHDYRTLLMKCESTEQRLSQAEAENERLVERQGERRKNWVKSLLDRQEEIKALEARLFHLMDVAGKMAGALDSIMETMAQPPDRIIDPIPVKDYAEIRDKVLNQAKLALAEWDGIKDGGK